MGRGVDVGPPLLSSLSLVLSQTPDRLISRFFLNLRSICHYGGSTAVSQTAVSVVSPIRTHPFWRRPRRLTTGFSFGLGAETSIHGDVTTRNERDIPQAESVEMDIGMELRTRQDEDNDEVKFDVDVIKMEEK